ncbi:hypothetical protein D3C81_2088650 [compost metagenome]
MFRIRIRMAIDAGRATQVGVLVHPQRTVGRPTGQFGDQLFEPVGRRVQRSAHANVGAGGLDVIECPLAFEGVVQ